MKKATGNEFQRWLVIPDEQEPYEDRRSVSAVQQYASNHHWDGMIRLGDSLDFDFISKYSKGALRLVTGKSFKGQYDYSNAALDRWGAAVRKHNPKARMIMIEGNHEFRVQTYLDYCPEHEGDVEVPVRLRFKERGVEWVPYWSKGDLFKLGHARFGHGAYVSKYHAQQMVTRYGCNIFYGHTHDVQTFSHVMHGKGKSLVGQSMGCLCLPQGYMRGRPDNWQQAFGVVYVEPSGMFTYYVVRLIGHAFISPEGRRYAA